MINCYYVAKENIKECNPNWPLTIDHRYRILIIEGSEKINASLNLIKQ